MSLLETSSTIAAAVVADAHQQPDATAVDSQQPAADTPTGDIARKQWFSNKYRTEGWVAYANYDQHDDDKFVAESRQPVVIVEESDLDDIDECVAATPPAITQDIVVCSTPPSKLVTVSARSTPLSVTPTCSKRRRFSEEDFEPIVEPATITRTLCNSPFNPADVATPPYVTVDHHAAKLARTD